jgi:hypothetical protein
MLCAVLAVSTIALAGCDWRRQLRPPYPASLPVDQRLDVWRHGQRVILHHVSVDSAFVSGSSRGRPPACDTCRVVIPRVEVDSLVLVNTSPIWPVVTIMGLFGFWLAVDPCWPNRGCT